MESKNDILLAIPVFNEVNYINKLMTAVKKHGNEILVIDDGSNDGTEEFLKKTCDFQLITHKKNLGYGKSLIDAFDFAIQNHFGWIITMDCDFQHQPDCLPSFYDEIHQNNADIVSGSRYLLPLKKREKIPHQRAEINQQITALLNNTLGLNLTDSFCGFKAYKTKSLRKLKLTEKGYAMPLQLWVQAAQQNLIIKEIPIPLIYHDPKRNFGGILEIPKYRLEYYLSVINRELNSHASLHGKSPVEYSRSFSLSPSSICEGQKKKTAKFVLNSPITTVQKKGH